MYLKKNKTRSGRIYLSIVEGYYDSERKTTRTRTVRSLGYLDELQKEYDDPVAYFKSRLQDERQQKAEPRCMRELTIDTSETMDTSTEYIQNFGYLVYSVIYHRLGLHDFINNHRRHSQGNYNANSVFRMLIFMHLLGADSALASYEARSTLLENCECTMDDVEDMLAYLARHKTRLTEYLYDRTSDLYGNDHSILYHYIVSYELGAHQGYIGLYKDACDLPLAFNTASSQFDFAARDPYMAKRFEELNFKKQITVTEMDLNDDIGVWYSHHNVTRHGYILHLPAAAYDEELRRFIEDPAGYNQIFGSYTCKSRANPRVVNLEDKPRERNTKIIYEKQVVFYHRDEPGAVTVLITSELHEDDENIIRHYVGLGRIRNIFRAGPDIMTDYAQSHFLICYVALLITSLIKRDTGDRINTREIMESVKRSQCIRLQGSYYMFTYYDEVLRLLGETYGIDFSRRFRSRKSIREAIADTKKKRR